MSFEVGDVIVYYPVEMRDIHGNDPVKGKVENIMGPDSIFNQQMLVLDTLDCWIPAYECKHEIEVN